MGSGEEMVNRTMEAKRIKYILQSKARPRTLRMGNGYQRVPQSIDRTKIPKEYQALFEYRKHAFSSSMEEFLDAKFPSHNQESVWDSTSPTKYFDRKTGLPILENVGEMNGRIVAKAESQLLERSTTLKTLLSDGKFTKMVMLSDTRLTCFYFIEYQVLPGILRRSVTYNSHSRALMVFQQQTIRWKEVIQIPSVE